MKWANEYVVVYSMRGSDGRPERVSGPGQFGIDNSKPGDPHHSPIWCYNYVVVPRDCVPNTRRSDEDCKQSGKLAAISPLLRDFSLVFVWIRVDEPGLPSTWNP